MNFVSLSLALSHLLIADCPVAWVSVSITSLQAMAVTPLYLSGPVFMGSGGKQSLLNFLSTISAHLQLVPLKHWSLANSSPFKILLKNSFQDSLHQHCFSFPTGPWKVGCNKGTPAHKLWCSVRSHLCPDFGLWRVVAPSQQLNLCDKNHVTCILGFAMY